MNAEELYAEFDDLLRNRPDSLTQESSQENLRWLGRAKALISRWNAPNTVLANTYISNIYALLADQRETAFKGLMILLYQAHHDLMMQTVGPISVVVPDSGVFKYFDAIRKKIQLAQKEILFVDPYLDAEFVTLYLPLLKPGVRIRLLARKKLDTLLPAVKLFAEENETTVEIRSAKNIHDRWLFVDGTDCYLSGASFKDGARSGPTIITQVVDAFSALSRTYEEIWDKAKTVS